MLELYHCLSSLSLLELSFSQRRAKSDIFIFHTFLWNNTSRLIFNNFPSFPWIIALQFLTKNCTIVVLGYASNFTHIMYNSLARLNEFLLNGTADLEINVGKCTFRGQILMNNDKLKMGPNVRLWILETMGSTYRTGILMYCGHTTQYVISQFLIWVLGLYVMTRIAKGIFWNGKIDKNHTRLGDH